MSAIKRPVQIEEFIITLREIQDQELYNIKQQLSRSIGKLEKTNNKLTKLINKEELNSESDDSDDEMNVDANDEQLFKEIVAENEIVANNQQERIEAINNELTHRGLPTEESGSDAANRVPKSTVKSNGKGSNADKGIDSSDNSGVDANAPNSIFI